MHNLADEKEDGITDKTIEEVNQCALPTENQRTQPIPLSGQTSKKQS